MYLYLTKPKSSIIDHKPKKGERDMGFLDRMSTVVQAKMNKIMDRMEDPREVLDVSYEKQLQLLQNVKRGVAEVTTSKKRIELQKAKLQMSIDKLDSQAKEAIQANREDLARKALENKALLIAQSNALDQQIADLNEQQQKLMAAESRLATKVEAFRTKKETIKAQYSAADAQVKITESVTGISEEMADVGMAVQRAEEKTENMKARSAALDELLESGTLTDLSGGDEIENELAKVKAKSTVEDELAKMKAEMKK
jgi:phage shock protein A